MTLDGQRGDGIVRRSAPEGCWAWVGVRLAPITPGAGSPGLYTDLGEPSRRADARTAETAWVAAWRRSDERPCFDLRYLSDPGSGSVSCALLGRVFAPDDATATRAAAALRERLARPPAHVAARPFADAAEVQRWLAPVEPHPDGLAEIRKRLTHSWGSRPGIPGSAPGRRICFAVSAFAGGDSSWEAVWLALARQRYPTLISLFVEPYPVADILHYALSALAREYTALATEIPGTLYRAAVPADAFAVEAQPLYAEALRRYADHAYRVRVSVASAGPLDPAFGELVAATISPPVRDGAFGGGGAVSRRPPPAELGPAWANITALRRGWLDATYRQESPPGSLDEPERILCDLTDVAETAAVFRFPYEIAGRPWLFDLPDRPVSRPAPGRSVVFLCHAEADRAVAANLHAHLRSDGVDGLWLAAEDLGGGREREATIRQAIERSRAVVVCLSRAVYERGAVNRHIAWALEVAMEQPPDTVFMIPARLEDCDIPHRLRTWQPVDLFTHDGYARLVHALGNTQR